MINYVKTTKKVNLSYLIRIFFTFLTWNIISVNFSTRRQPCLLFTSLRIFAAFNYAEITSALTTQKCLVNTQNF